MLQEAIKFIHRNVRFGAEITGLTRTDLPQYPLIAIREALVNAIVHTDYAIKGMHISVAIFDDRIEITNPGGLPFGFTLEKALSGSSRIRNRVIAKVFYHLKLIEQWARGLQLIVKECDKIGLADPRFEELNNQFRVTLYAAKKRKTDMDSWQKDFVRRLAKQKRITTKQAASFWNVTPRTARSRLIKMINAGLVRKTGTSLTDPYGQYVLNREK